MLVPTNALHNQWLLLVYINDLPNCLLNSQPRMYTNDTHLTFAAKTVLNIDRNLQISSLSILSLVYVDRSGDQDKD